MDHRGQTNKLYDNYHDESKTRTYRFCKLPDDGDPWVPKNLLKPRAKGNQRTNDPINAHLRSGICDLSVMVYINFVDLLSLMLHARLQNHRPGSGERIFM